jgi:hypothetical protein
MKSFQSSTTALKHSFFSTEVSQLIVERQVKAGFTNELYTTKHYPQVTVLKTCWSLVLMHS